MKLEQVVHAEIIHADLALVDAHFTSVGIRDLEGMVRLKTALIALTNVADFETHVSSSYKEHPEPAALIKDIKQNLKFAKYLRNKVVGHMHDDLIPKAIEWHPTLRRLPGQFDRPGAAAFANLLLLETAINTYVDENGKHKVFDTGTDLVYPPDQARFRDFLEGTIRGSLAYLKSLVAYWAPRVAEPIDAPLNEEQALKAGLTEFKFLTQKK